MNTSRAVLMLLSLSILTPSLYSQYKSEYRVFQVKIQDSDAGTYTQTITTYGEGTTDVVGKSDVKFKVLGITYQQAYRGQERWKENKLQYLAAACNDNGDKRTLLVTPEKNQLKVKDTKKEHFISPDAWSTSYWTLPPEDKRTKPLIVLDADTGIESQVMLQNMGKVVMVVGSNRVTCTHYRITGGIQTDLWFDENNRLVRREGLRKGRKVVLHLVSATVQ